MLEPPLVSAYYLLMVDTTQRAKAPAGWLEALAESEAEAEAGLFVDGDVVHRELREAVARLEAKATTRKVPKTARR